MTAELHRRVSRAQLMALGIGLLVLAICGAGAFSQRRQFFASYLFGLLFWLGLVLGCWGVLMLHHLTGGRWGFPIRRILEAGTQTLPLMLLLFVPLLFGLRELYPWARPGVRSSSGAAVENTLELSTAATPDGVAAPEDGRTAKLHKHVYLNRTGFILRSVVFFAVW